ncbi:MAG: PAS domain-containing protein [Nitrospirae bacterium]|nr:PAS domain-containing protein [Nitrospirota bacterium]
MKSIFKRIFIIYLAVFLLSLVFIELYVTDVVRTDYISNLTESLSTQAGLIAEGSLFDEARLPDEFCINAKEKTGARVTAVDNAGNVLCDSDKDASSMENHGSRPEIMQALASGTGSARRYSDTLGYDLLYVAKRIITEDNVKGFIRMSVNLNDVDAAVNGLRFKINLAVLFIFLLSGLVIVWQTEKIRKFVGQITEYAGALEQGLFRKKLYMKDAGEFTEIAESLNEMASELKLNIEKKEKEANRLNVVLKSIPDALLLINPLGNIDLSNNAAVKMFGMSGRNKRPFMEVVRNPALINLIDGVKKNRLPASAEIVMDFPEERHLSVSASPLFYNEGELAGIVAIFHDTTALRRLEEVRKDFIANVSHEIKTPVTAISGFADALLDGALQEKENAEKFIRTIRANSGRLNRLVDDLLTLSKIESGAIKISRAEVDINQIIDSVIETLKARADAKGLFLARPAGAAQVSLNADRGRLEQILLNLADNALKFTEKGGVEIGVSSEDGKNYIFVRDTGIGIPENSLSRLGERFFRVDPSRSREMGGTGLGLAIVKHLVKAHGWEMKIESEAGKGTAVKIYHS